MNQKRRNLLLIRLDRLPPCACRLLARKELGKRGKSHMDIANESGLGKSTVAKFSRLTTWRGMKIEDIDAFASACGVNILAPSKQMFKYLNIKKGYLNNGHPDQRRMYQNIFQLRRDSNR